MSLAAMTWAFGIELRPAALKFLLVALADNADTGGRCYPSLETLARKTCLDRKTVIRGLDELERIGFLLDTRERIGRTGRVKIYRLVGFDIGERHYTYRITDLETGEFYIGVRTCAGEPTTDSSYMGSGTWPLQALRERRQLTKVVLAEYESREEANSAEFALIGEVAADPLCRNNKGTANGGKNGTVAHVAPNSAVFSGNGSVIPANGAVFSGEQSQKRHSESFRESKEPSGTVRSARAKRSPDTAKRLPPDFKLTEQRRSAAVAERVDPDREFANFSDHFTAASGARARKHDWDAAWRIWCRKAADMQGDRSSGRRSGKGPTVAQSEADALQKLKDRRAAIGLTGFRDPHPSETADAYTKAQDAEWSRIQTQKGRDAPRFPDVKGLVAAKGVPT